jgi:hypothetical protein
MSVEPRAAAASVERRRRLPTAVATSALVHLIALLALFRGLRHHPPPGPAPQLPAPADLEISLLEPPKPPVAPIEPSAPEPANPPREGHRRSTPAPTSGPRTPGPAPEASAPVPETRPAQPSGTPAPRSGPIDLSFDVLAGDAKRRAAGEGHPDEALEQRLVPQPEPSGHGRGADDLRADAERRADAVANVELGRANPQLYDYLRAARDRLEDEATHLAENLPLGPKESTKGWGRGYLKRLDEIHQGRARDLPESPDDAFDRRPDILGGYNEAEHQARSGAEERTAEVCLGVTPGHPVVVTLQRSSKLAALDKLAVDSFRAAGDARPVATDVRTGVACYRVRISAFRMPPVPSLSLGLDKKNRPVVIYPLKRITKVTVELKSVDYGPTPRSSPLLRQP